MLLHKIIFLQCAIVSTFLTLANVLSATRAVCFKGRSSLGVPGVPWHPQILAYQLTLSKPGGADYAHHMNTGIPGFSDLLTALYMFCYWLQ